ncbi:MAG: amidohydrolase family protein [Lachnospiraceae bacterium]
MVLIENGNVHFPKGETKKVDILIEGDRIVEIGEKISVDAEHIDASGCEVFAGFILPATSVGVYNYADLAHPDSEEKSTPVNPDLHVRYSLDPAEVKLQGYERHGVTAFGAVPGDPALIAGQIGVYHTSGRTAAEMAVSEDVALKVNFIPSVKRTFASRDVMPMTRMGMASMLRNELKKASLKKEDDASYDPGRDVICRVLNKELPILCNVRERFDIETILGIQKEFGFKLILMGAYQADSLQEKLKEAGVSVLLGDLIDGSLVTYFDADIPALLKMSKKVLTAFSNNGSGYEGLLWSAEKAVRNGLKVEQAIDMLTINTADILGVGDKTGSIEAGKYADISIWDGHPLKTYDAHIKVCMTAGKIWRAEQ